MRYEEPQSHLSWWWYNTSFFAKVGGVINIIALLSIVYFLAKAVYNEC